MPWKETCIMDQRVEFIVDYVRGEWSLSQLCQFYGISRPTAYKWIGRWEAGGWEGLKDRSRAPHSHPNAVNQEIEELILQARQRYPSWGPKKLRVLLQRQYPKQGDWPCETTIGTILKRHGLVVGRRKRYRGSPTQTGLTQPQACNRVWCADFKGWFRTGDGKRCDPLTIMDGCSRYLLRCQGMREVNTEGVQRLFQATFREYGLPQVIRTDNGTPFASIALAGLSRLSVRWIQLGITPERIEPGKPQQNGSHERMHRTLKAQTQKPPSETLRKQQSRFDAFVREYNEERPHEALGLQTPAEVYEYSPRQYPHRTPRPEYSEDSVVRKVRHKGEIHWQSHRLFLSELLQGEYVAMQPVDERYWEIYYYHYPVAVLDSDKVEIIRPGTRQYRQWKNQQTNACPGASASASPPGQLAASEQKV